MDVSSVFLTRIIKLKVLALLDDVCVLLEGIKQSGYWHCRWQNLAGEGVM